MSGFALEPVPERRLIIEQVAARRGILPVIVEKDFYLVPAEHRHEELARDLEAMRPMFLTEVPTFTVLLKQLEEAEEGLNQASGQGGRPDGIKSEN